MEAKARLVARSDRWAASELQTRKEGFLSSYPSGHGLAVTSFAYLTSLFWICVNLRNLRIVLIRVIPAIRPSSSKNFLEPRRRHQVQARECARVTRDHRSLAKPWQSPPHHK